MRRFIAILLILVSLAASAAVARWEVVEVPGQLFTEQRAEGDPVDVVVKDGYLYVACSKTVSVKVFTILGQLISQETLPPGTHRLQMSAKGIYILKVGSSTRRITI